MLRLKEDKLGQQLIAHKQLEMLKHSDRRALNTIMFSNAMGLSTIHRW